MASGVGAGTGASSLDGNDAGVNIPHGFLPTNERNTVTLPTIPLPMDFESLAQSSGYDSQPGYQVVAQPPYEGMTTSYDQSQYESSSKQNNDGLKQQYELNALRRQHSETSRRCEHAMKELEYFRAQHRAAVSQLEVSTQESNNLRGKYGDLLAENQRLERDLQRLKQDGAGTGVGASDVGETGDAALMHALQEYDVLKKEYELLRKRYDEVFSTHSAASEQLQHLQDENTELKSQGHELTQTRNSAIRERNGWKQQCDAAIRQWDIALRERNNYSEALDKVKSQHEEAVREMNQAMSVRVKATKDIKRLTEERNAAMHEYSLIMSERDTVHKEMEKLSDDLARAVKRASTSDAELAAAHREKRALLLQAESLRREIASALLDRDRALKECSELTRNANNPNQAKTRLDSSVYHHHGHGSSGSSGKDGSNGEQGADASIDKLQGLVGMVLNPKHKERVDDLETANQELDRLRKSLDKLQAELTEAHQEAEVSKRRRDWAFSERDKIVLERESIRTLCDRLRKERDRAVSDLAEALRDSDDIKKQRNEAWKELKELKEKYETELEKDGPGCRVHRPPVTHNHSRDSAIDADLQEWESEFVEVDLMDIPSGGDLGFELAGGRDDPYYPNDYGIYVVSIQKGSIADGKLKVMDCILEVAGSGPVCGNGSSLQQALRDRGGRARLVIRRRRPRSRCLHTAQLNRANVADHGLQLQQGIYISKIIPGSLAAKEGNLAIGDRVLSINNRLMDGVKSSAEAMMILNDRHYDTVTITTLKHISHSGSTNSDLSNRFSPIKEPYGIPHLPGKMVNSCSQTDEAWYPYNIMSGDQKVPTSLSLDTPISEMDKRFIYKVSNSPGKPSHDKSHSSSGNHEKGTWDMILGKIEAVTFRSKSKDKQNRQSVIPESDAIAELDSVIESYHGKSNKESSVGSVLKRSKRLNKDSSSGSKSSKNNGGTWPKARSNVNFQDNPTGTIVQPKAKKERLPLTVLLSPPTKEVQRNNRNSNPIPVTHLPVAQSTTPTRHSVYKSIESSSNPPSMQIHFPKQVSLSIHNPFTPAKIVNFHKMRTLEKDKHGLTDFAEHDMTPNRLSRNLNPSDDSLDFQPVTRDSKSPHSLDFLGTSKGPSSIEFVSSMSSMSKVANTIDYLKVHSGKDILDYYTVKKSSPKTVSKYPSDSESLGPDSLGGGLPMGFTSTLPSHSRIQSQLYRSGGVPPFVNPHPHHLPPVRYSHPASPTMSMTQSQSGESLGVGIGYECPPFGSHPHNAVDVQPSVRVARNNNSDHYHHHTYEGGTFPPKKENQRFRIPSNPSVTSKNSAGKVSTGSIEPSSERGSPMPTFHVEVLSPGRGAHNKLTYSNARNSMPEYCGMGWHKPLPGELRRVHIDKSQQPLGIQISCPPESGGVFVSTVNEHSLASQVGLQVGDQLLEVCGINMRSATYKLAANVLRQCGNSITMLVQYSPDKYNELEGSASSSEEEPSGDEVSVSGSPTPRNSPGPQQSLRMEAPTTDMNSNRPNPGNKESSLEPRFLSIEMRKSSDLGISLVGGNSVGIFVHSVQIDSPAYNAGLRTGDQILEYNNADLRHATAEQAALELAKPADKVVTVLARYDIQRYHEIKDKPGDAFFVRAGFDRSVDLGSSGVDPQLDAYALWFKKDEVIFVDNTLFNGAPGLWRAWQLDHKGSKQQWGTIPSKFKVEELLRRSVGSLEGTADGTQNRRGLTATRRSFFKRKKHRDPKELASFSNTNLGWWSDSGNLNEEFPLCSYQRVERLNYPCHRPVVVIGPLWECVVEKVVTDFPNEFSGATPEPVQLSGGALEKALASGKYLEPRMRGHYLECISLQSIKDACDKGMHCILDIGVASIEKLHKQQIYPIVIQIKFKSTKQIKEVKDKHSSLEKVSGKAIKEMYEHSLKMETEFRQYVSAVIPAGVNIAYMCTQLKAAVDEEQGKPLWVPSPQT